MQLSITFITCPTDLEEMSSRELIAYAESEDLGPHKVLVIGDNLGSETMREEPHLIAYRGVVLWHDLSE